MQTKLFRIGELAKRLAIEPFVIRFWEKEFNISPARSQGQQRFYTKKELALFSRIKELLYTEKLTIAGAKKQLLSGAISYKHDKNTEKNDKKVEPKKLIAQLMLIREQLVKLKENF